MAWVILVLGVVWFVMRQIAARAEEQRRIRHDERMAELMAEREAMLQREEAPSSLAATTSDAPDEPKSQAASTAPAVKVRCKACRALNDEEATTCASCGAAL